MDEQETEVRRTGFLKFTILVNASPYASEAADLAYRFTVAALAKGHRVRRVFFYRDGVYHALRFAASPADASNQVARWTDLADAYGVDLVICSAAAQRRGVLTPEIETSLAPRFRVAGLALLVESMLETDRLLVFG